MGTGWIVIAERQKTESTLPAERRVPVEDLSAGDIFSLNTQSRKFELRDIKPKENQIVARIVNVDGSFSSEVVLDYQAHRQAPVIVWGHEPLPDLTASYNLFDKVRLKSADLSGIILDLDKSRFPECDILVMWEQALNGEAVTEVHAHEIESLGERFSGQQMYGNGDRSLSEIRNVVLDLRGAHDKKVEDQTKKLIQDQIEESLKEHAAVIEQLDAQQRQEISHLCDKAVACFASEFKAITDACVIFVSGGDHNYEADRIGELLSNYSDSIYHRASTLTQDPAIAGGAAIELMNIIAASALESYFMTRLGIIRLCGDKWGVYSKKGKPLGIYSSKKGALKRIRGLEYYKRHGEIGDIDSTEVPG